MNALEVKAMLYEDLGLCGCSDLGSVIDVLRTTLKWAGGKIGDRALYGEVLYGDEGVYYLIAGLLDGADLIEHGCSIRQPWLTEKGEAFLSAIIALPESEICGAEGESESGVWYEKDQEMNITYCDICGGNVDNISPDRAEAALPNGWDIHIVIKRKSTATILDQVCGDVCCECDVKAAKFLSEFAFNRG